MLVVQDHGLGVNEMMLHQSITNNTATHTHKYQAASCYNVLRQASFMTSPGIRDVTISTARST